MRDSQDKNCVDHNYASNSTKFSITSSKKHDAIIIHKKTKSRSHDIKLTQFVDKMTSKEKDEIDTALAKFFFGCNIPFSVSNSDHFKNFIKIIRPSYAPPCRQTLATTLLDRVSKEIDNMNERHLSKHSKHTTLIIDGWKNSSNNTKNIVTMLQVVGGPSTFLASTDLSDSQETGEALAEILDQSVDLAKEKYGCEIYAVVSDNAANMIKMGRLSNLWHSTCSSHTGNLLVKDVLHLETINKVNLVLKEFKHTNLEKRLIDNGGSKILLPAETRWCSQRDACKCFLKNLSTMKKIAAEGDIKVKAEVTYLLYDDNFLCNIQNSVAVLDPICELVNNCQKIEFSVADAVEEWLNLPAKIPEELLTDEIETAIRHRTKMATNIYAMTANYLHPIYKGLKLNNEQKSSVKTFLLDHLNSEGLNGLHNFERSLGIFEKLFNKKDISWSTFWGYAETDFPTLASLSQKLISIPASSAQLERIFSNWSFVHSTLRNRLGQDKSSKLISIYYSLKLTDTNKCDQY